MVRREPVARPLPDVPAHVVKPVPVRREGPDRRCSLIPVEPEVMPRELALPGVRGRSSPREVLLAPSERCAFQAAPRGQFPLGLCGEVFAGPLRVCLRVLIGDMDNWMPVPSIDRRSWAARTPPVGAGRVLPPAS